MRLLLQTLLAIVPLFMALAAMSGGLIYVNKQQELTWAARERSLAAAVTTAEFLREGWLREAAKPDADMDAFAAGIGRRLEQIAERNLIQRILLVLNDGTVVAQFGSASGQISTIADLREATAAIAAGTPFVSDVVLSQDTGYTVVAIVPITDRSDTVVGTLRLRTDASRYGVEMAEVKQLIAWMAAVIVVAGIVVALLVTWRIAGPLNRIGRRIADVADGRTEQWQPVGGLREIEDLDESLRTVQAVMRNEIAKSRFGLLENEQLRSLDVLLYTLEDRYAAPQEVERGGLVVHLRGMDRGNGSFFDLLPYAPGGCVVMGRAAARGAGGALVAARGFLALLERLLASGAVADGLARAAALFPEVTATVVLWTDGGDALDIREIADGRATRGESLALKPGRTVAVETLDEQGASVLARYLDHYADLSPRDLGGDLEPLLRNRAAGCVALFSPVRARAAA